MLVSNAINNSLSNYLNIYDISMYKGMPIIYISNMSDKYKSLYTNDLHI